MNLTPGYASESQAYENLIVGHVDVEYLLVDSAATVAVGQVLQYDTTGHNFVNFTSGIAAAPYVVCGETKEITADTRIKCITCGRVNKTKLDATAKADADIEAALLTSGIRAIANAV